MNFSFTAESAEPAENHQNIVEVSELSDVTCLYLAIIGTRKREGQAAIRSGPQSHRDTKPYYLSVSPWQTKKAGLW